MGLLAEFLSASVDQYGDMKVIGYRQIEHLLQIDLSRRRVEQVASAQNFGDALLVIIDHHSQLIGIGLIAPTDDKVSCLFGQILFDAALQPVVDADGPCGCFDSERMRLLPADFFIPAAARIDGAPSSVRLRQSTNRFSGTVAWIDQPPSLQALQSITISLGTLTLIQHRTIPMQSEALECSEDRVGGSGDRSEGIEIVDANEPLTLSRSGLEKAGERRIERAEMEGTGWRRCEPAPIRDD